MKIVNRLVVNILIALTSIILLSGCHTVEGFGKDMQQGGQELQKSANENK